MEDWQEEHITKNLQKLASLTLFNCEVQAELRAQNILGKADVEKLNALINQNGNCHASFQCYEWLVGRRNAYKILTNALLQSNQTGAARVLIHGVPNELYDKPLAYLGISTKVDCFKNVDIQVHGRNFKINQFFPLTNLETLQQVFQETIPEMEIYDNFVSKERTFVLANNTIPPKPPFYIPRYLSNRIQLDTSIFKAKCPDVFVFKPTIARYQLTELARPNPTASSNSQVDHITSRFIYLDHNEDWTDLKNSARVPIHLINYDVQDNLFLLEDTSASTEILRKVDSQKDRVYLSEDEFLRQQLTEDTVTSSVCICDTPGMGKTFLLSNIARRLAENSVGRIVLFIQLNSFSTNFDLDSSNSIPSHQATLLQVLMYCSPSEKQADLLIKLLEYELIVVEIFFDGFDEISQNKVNIMKQVFQSLTTQFPQVKIYISSRPHMRQELEESLHVIAYDIMPFTRQNQIDYLVQFWSQNLPSLDHVPIQKYATVCLEKLNASISRNDKAITGVPLLCQLIAEVAKYSTKTRIRKLPINLSYLYAKFIQGKINAVARNENEFAEIKLVHYWLALKLLFPQKGFHDTNQFENVNHEVVSSTILTVGIIHQQPNAAMEFIHRTFAEYLVAEYFLAKLQEEKTEEFNLQLNSVAVLNLLLKSYKSKYWFRYDFLRTVIVSFLDSIFDQANISEDLKSQVASFCTSISPQEFLTTLCACCQHGFYNIFSLLKTGMTKCDSNWIREYFSTENSFQLLSSSIGESTSQMFFCCIGLFTVVLQLEVGPILEYVNGVTLLQRAVDCTNYEVVEYLLDKVPLQNQDVIRNCVEYSYYSMDTMKRENILLLLLNKDCSLIQEDRNILAGRRIHLKFIKILVKFGASVDSVGIYGDNCVVNAAVYMNSKDYHELIQYILTDCKAEKLFLDNEKWSDPFAEIIYKAKLLPQTLELLLKIPGIDINMNDKYGQNLLFSAVQGNKLDNVQQLVNRGLDFKASGSFNRSLLHLAARHEYMNMVEYLLSLKLDPNSLDNDESTPLHKAAEHNNDLSVIEILVGNGANVLVKNSGGRTALHLAAMKNQSSNNIINYLIQKGLGVNDRDKDGNNPLHLCRRKEIREYLVKMGANIHAINKKGQTPKQTKRV